MLIVLFVFFGSSAGEIIQDEAFMTLRNFRSFVGQSNFWLGYHHAAYIYCHSFPETRILAVSSCFSCLQFVLWVFYAPDSLSVPQHFNCHFPIVNIGFHVVLLTLKLLRCIKKKQTCACVNRLRKICIINQWSITRLLQMSIIVWVVSLTFSSRLPDEIQNPGWNAVIETTNLRILERMLSKMKSWLFRN